MEWIKRNASDLLPIVIAIVVPLAGILLALQAGVSGDRTHAVRIGAACVLGVCLWALILTA
jgi:threonine/homoserine/homoserine lactone efflux protein